MSVRFTRRRSQNVIPGTEVGERVKIEITEVESNFAYGEIVEEDV